MNTRAPDPDFAALGWPNPKACAEAFASYCATYDRHEAFGLTRNRAAEALRRALDAHPLNPTRRVGRSLEASLRAQLRTVDSTPNPFAAEYIASLTAPRGG